MLAHSRGEGPRRVGGFGNDSGGRGASNGGFWQIANFVGSGFPFWHRANPIPDN